MKTNIPASTLTPTTHEGGTAARQTPLTELTRAVSTCLLWENTFYEKGSAIAQRMADLCDTVPLADIASQLDPTALGFSDGRMDVAPLVAAACTQTAGGPPARRTRPPINSAASLMRTASVLMTW